MTEITHLRRIEHALQQSKEQSREMAEALARLKQG
jgi:hypothetical protein